MNRRHISINYSRKGSLSLSYNNSVREKISHISQHRRNPHISKTIKAGRFAPESDIYQPIFQSIPVYLPAVTRSAASAS